MNDTDAHGDVRACIAYYDAHGWDWLSAVGFICYKHLFPRGSRIVSAEWRFFKRHHGRKRRPETGAGGKR